MDTSFFVRQVIEDPFDPDIRLVFADYLEEHEDARSELIRMQAERTSVAIYDPRRLELVAREQEVLKRAGYSFFGQLPDGVPPLCSEGGFYSGVSLSVTAFLKLRSRLFKSAPITTLRLDGRTGKLQRLADSKELKQIENLTFAVNAGPEQLSLFFSSPNLIRLKTLKLEIARLTPDIMSTILQSAFAANLESIEFSKTYGTGDWVLETIAGTPPPKLTALALGDSRVSEAGIALLSDSEAFESLRSLQFSGAFSSTAFARLQDMGVCQKLVRLSAQRPSLTSAAFELQSPLQHLRWLHAGSALTSADLKRILKHYPKLEILELPGNTIDDTGVACLLESGIYNNLRRLDLSGNQITLEGAEDLGFENNGTTEVLLDQNALNQADVKSIRNRFGTTFGRFSIRRTRST